MSTATIDEGKLNAFVGQMLSDLGGASSIAMVRLGDTLGLYRAIHDNGPMTSAELAKQAKVDERYLREWLSHQAASNYLDYDPAVPAVPMPAVGRGETMWFALEVALLVIPARPPAQTAADVEVLAENVPHHVLGRDALGGTLVVGAAGRVDVVVAGIPALRAGWTQRCSSNDSRGAWVRPAR